jgi:uncharacterized protein YjbI with pentapeptide repeats
MNRSGFVLLFAATVLSFNFSLASTQSAEQHELNEKRQITREEEAAISWDGCKRDSCPNIENRFIETLNYAEVDGGRFRGSDFNYLGYSTDLTKIQNSDLRDTTITVLGGCNLSGSDLRGAVIKTITHADAGLITTILDGTDLRGASIIEITALTSVSLKGAVYDSTTQLPFTDEVAATLGMIKR